MNNPRVVFAFLLSLLFLFVWNTLFPPVQRSSVVKKDTPVSVTSTVPSEDKTAVDRKQPSAYTMDEGFAIPDEVIVLENESLRLTIDAQTSLIAELFIKTFDTRLPVQISAMLPFEGTGRLIRKKEYAAEWKFIYNNSDWTKKIQIGKNEINISILENKISSLEIPVFDIVHDEKDYHDLGRDRSLNEIFYKIENKVVRKNNAVRFNEKFKIDTEKPVEWFGFRNRYFCLVIKPINHGGTIHVKPINQNRLRFVYDAKDAAKTINFKIYAGPQSLKLLKDIDPDFSEVMKFSRFGLLDFTAKMIYELLLLCHRIVPNWGLSILLISILIYLLMFPLTIKGMASMKKMQALQPKITRLREKYKNNPQKLNKEMMELYQKHKINPLSGCLPLIFQMPVFIGLYQVLWRSVDLKGQGFLWIKDLSEPDRFMMLPFHLPIIGNEFNLLPILMMAAMVFQQKVSAMSQTAVDPQQKLQQRLMMTVFPVFLGIIFYKFPSGLNLYFTVFYLLSTFTQWKISRMTWSFDDAE